MMMVMTMMLEDQFQIEMRSEVVGTLHRGDDGELSHTVTMRFGRAALFNFSNTVEKYSLQMASNTNTQLLCCLYL